MTKRSTRRLSDAAQHVVVPAGVVATGFGPVEAKCAELGISFRWWQREIGRIILAKREGGSYAATVGGTGVSICRQAGKTFLVAAIVFALCLLRPGLTTIWTAHRLRTSEETFRKMQAMTRRRLIAPHVAKVVLGSGEEAILFRNGSRVLFGARERGFGRGFDEVDVLIFDEAQILTASALDDMVPATNQSRQESGALLLFLGTPPKPTDPGEVFTRMRAEALAGEDPDTGWIEFGVDEDYDPPPLPEPLAERDWRQVAKANPSFPDDTPREAIQRMRKQLGPDSYVREGLGRWDKVDPATASADVFGAGVWAARRMEQPDDLRPAAVGLALSVDRSVGSIGAAGLFETTNAEGELVEATFVAPVVRRPGVSWLVGEALRLQTTYDCPVVVDGRGPAKDLIKDLEDAGVEVTEATLDEYAEGCSRLIDKARERLLGHPGAPELDEAVAGAVWRNAGDRQVWGRRKSAADVSMLEAVTLAAREAEMAGTFSVY